MNLFLVPVHLRRSHYALLEELCKRLEARTPFPVGIRHIETGPELGFDVNRHQYNSSSIIQHLSKHSGSDVLLGVCDADLFIPIFTFVLGEAQLSGNAGVVSVYRLRNSFYGLPDDPELFMKRLFKVALHEWAHLLGLMHCLETSCLMHASSSVEEVDIRGDEFCPECQSIVWQYLNQIKQRQ